MSQNCQTRKNEIQIHTKHHCVNDVFVKMYDIICTLNVCLLWHVHYLFHFGSGRHYAPSFAHSVCLSVSSNVQMEGGGGAEGQMLLSRALW